MSLLARYTNKKKKVVHCYYNFSYLRLYDMCQYPSTNGLIGYTNKHDSINNILLKSIIIDKYTSRAISSVFISKYIPTHTDIDQIIYDIWTIYFYMKAIIIGISLFFFVPKNIVSHIPIDQILSFSSKFQSI